MYKHVARFVVLAVALGMAPAALANFECPPVAGFFGLKLTVKDYHLSLGSNKSKNIKLPICIALDKSIKVRIQNPGSSDFQVKAGDVTVKEKPGSHVLISGSNSANKKYLVITIKEPSAGFDPDLLGDCNDGTEDCAGFDIVVAGLGKLDPKVRVVDNNVMLLRAHETLVDVFADLDVTLNDVEELFREFGTGTE